MIVLVAELKGGLCNKLFCLASAIDICLKHGYGLVEPVFGWKRPIPFRQIWNVDRFHAGFPELCLIEPGSDQPSLTKTGAELWAYSEALLAEQRRTCHLPRDSVLCRLVQCLEPAVLVPCDVSKSIAVHIRNEEDWRTYSKKKQPRLPQEEHIWTDVADIYLMCQRQFPGHEDWFITCGTPVAFGETAVRLYDDNLEYEQNAALNWYLCSKAGAGFVGLTRSTFSNLIALRRVLTGVAGESWIYNYGTELGLRVDAGLQADAAASIKNKTIFTIP